MENSEYQQTLKQPIMIEGISLHAGTKTTLTITPAPVNHGIQFIRTDIKADKIKASVANITDTQLNTTIGIGANKVSTIEHLMAAFAGLEIDNVLVAINGSEIPILDGSSEPFIDAIFNVGIRKQKSLRTLYKVKQELIYTDKDRWIKLSPSENVEYECSIDYGDEVIGSQNLSIELNPRNFLSICSARTFCHLNDVKAMHAMGLALGGSIENAIVVDDKGIINKEGLRYKDEFVSHKILDCIGDLNILHGKIIAKVSLHKPGHSLHAGCMRYLMKNLDKYIDIINPKPEIQAQESSHKSFNLAAKVATDY